MDDVTYLESQGEPRLSWQENDGVKTLDSFFNRWKKSQMYPRGDKNTRLQEIHRYLEVELYNTKAKENDVWAA
jgi:hypothetical protein